MKEITTSNNKSIKVYDDLFTYRERCNMFAMMRKIPFQFWAAYDTLITDQESSFIVKYVYDFSSRWYSISETSNVSGSSSCKFLSAILYNNIKPKSDRLLLMSTKIKGGLLCLKDTHYQEHQKERPV